MKKLLFATAVALVIIAGATSCKPKKKCYRIDTVYTYISEEQKTMSIYAWESSVENAVATVGSNIALSMIGVKIISTNAIEVNEYSTQADCEAQNKTK